MRFILKDTNIFLLPNNNHMLHVATIDYKFREFIVMIDRRTNKLYIEEAVLETTDFTKDVWANFKFIDDDSLAYDLFKFCEEKKLIDMKKINEYLIDTKQIII